MTRFFAQLSKYLTVGMMNTVIDFGVLNILMFATGITAGFGYAVFKSISVSGAVINSYFLNKYWTFGSPREASAPEFAKFLSVSAVGFLLNVSVATIIVTVIRPIPGISTLLWANLAAAIAAATTTMWNFLGYKYVVFRRMN